MHDSPSAVSRERSSSLQGMDMASLPPRKRPWHDGPGTGDMDSPGAGPDDRGAGETRDYMKIMIQKRPIKIMVMFSLAILDSF